jgi:hypothetical protein
MKILAEGSPMKMIPLKYLLACITLPAAQSIFAQGEFQMQPRHMSGWNPNANQGRCRLLLWVDQRADVRIRGFDIWVKTLQGAPSRDEGSECNQPMPATVQSFQIQTVKGRGKVWVSQTPNPQNRYQAVVSIDDFQGGAASYVVDLNWVRGGPAPGPPPPRFDEVLSCQDGVRNEFYRRNRGNQVTINFQGAPGRINMSGNRLTLRGRAVGRSQYESRDMSYACTVNLQRLVVESATYTYLGNGLRSAQAMQ